jgi:hypothetical protein
MAVYVVTWDLNREKPNYAQARAAFIKQLETYENKKDSGLDSVRFISTTSSADNIVNFLDKKLDDNDRLLVSRIRAGEHQGWLEKPSN